MEKYSILVSDAYQGIIDKKRITNINVGNIFEINDNKFVLTCYHCIRKSYNNTLFLKNESYKCNVHSINPELELGLLSFEKCDLNNSYKMSDFEIPFCRENRKFTIKTFDIDLYVKTKAIKNIDISCSFHDILLSSHVSLNSPKMPFIRVTLDGNYNDISQLSGISGSIITNDKDKIIGIVSSIIELYVYIIPSYVITKFLANYSPSVSFLPIQYNACIFEQDELPSKQIYGIYINNLYGIKSKLLKNDIIIQIDNNNICEGNTIYDKNIDYPLDFNTFIALNIKCNDTIKMKVARLQKGSYKEKEIMVEIKALDKIKYIPIESNNKIFKFANMTFIELSEDTINYYIDLGIFTGKSVKDKYIESPFRLTESFVVILIDIDKKKVSSKIKQTMVQLGLPIVPIIPIQNKQYSYTVIKKINNNPILTLDDLVKYSNEKCIINAHIESYGKLNITVKNDEIISIIKGK